MLPESNQLTIETCSVGRLEGADNFQPMLDEYANELAMPGLPHPKAKIETYHQLEQLGILQPIGAFMGSKLIGVIIVLMAANQHYGLSIAVSESFFVCQDYRKTGAGLKLLRAAEKYARSKNSPGFFVSSKSGSSLEMILPNVGYTENNRTFFKCLN